MPAASFDGIYAEVPKGQKERLLGFRATHPERYLVVGGRDWRYVASGQGEEVLLFLTGGLNYGEYWFRTIMALESDYRTLAPTYPLARTIQELVDGLQAVLDTEGVQPMNLVGNSFGGMLAQCFVRKYPNRVRSMVLGDTTPPDRAYRGRTKRVIKASSWMPSWLLRPIVERTVWKWVSPIPEDERDFWRAYFREYMVKQWTRAAFVTSYRWILDFVENCSFAQTDLVSWPGKIMIVESDDDRAVDTGMREALKAMYPQAKVCTFHAAGHVPLITSGRSTFP